MSANMICALNAYINFLAAAKIETYETVSRILRLLVLALKNDVSIDLDEADKDFVLKLVLSRLPSVFYQPEENIIGSLESVITDFFNFCDLKYGSRLNFALNSSELDIFPELRRIIRLKKLMLKFYKNPLMSVNPIVVDIDGYRFMKSTEKRDVLFLSDEFEVFEFFGRNSIVLKKEGEGGYFIRLYFDPEIVALFKRGDTLRLKLKKYEDFSNWSVAEVYEIFPLAFCGAYKRKGVLK
ncbi:MAG: hypothetical protein VB120_07720 [Lachnospiraceae bacterium]|nr:hypothetical protein [Lachnospiraceae bacterium]